MGKKYVNGANAINLNFLLLRYTIHNYEKDEEIKLTWAKTKEPKY